MNYKIIKSKRNSISIVINKNAEITVRAPINALQKTIDDFIQTKNAWIQKTVQKILQSKKVYTYTEGEAFEFLGNSYFLSFITNQFEPVIFDNTTQKLKVSATFKNNAKDRLLKFYKKEAIALFKKRLTYWSRVGEFEFKAFKLTNAGSKWGSCTADNRIFLSWKLIMAPLYVIDYVIVHELVHTVHKNHSKTFWNAVDAVYKKQLAFTQAGMEEAQVGTASGDNMADGLPNTHVTADTPSANGGNKGWKQANKWLKFKDLGLE